MFIFRMASPVHRLIAWRAARVGFGATLIVGAGAVVHGVMTHARVLGLPAAHWFAIVWAAAFVVAALAWLAVRLRARIDPGAFAVTGLTVPAIGFALMAPLTLQLPFVIGASGLAGFDGWVPLSVAITGVAHLVLAALSVVRARQLARDAIPIEPRTIFGAVVVVSMIPFALLAFIPPILVAITGAAYLPILHAQAWIANRDRAILSTMPPLARAIAA